jgi:hypothetical protein
MTQLDYKPTEFVLLVLGVMMTVVALVVGIVLYRMAVREHRAQLEREKREAGKAAPEDVAP